MKNIFKKSFAKALISLFILAITVTPVFAHHPVLSGNVTCVNQQTKTVTWTIGNSESNKTMYIEDVDIFYEQNDSTPEDFNSTFEGQVEWVEGTTLPASGSVQVFNTMAGSTTGWIKIYVKADFSGDGNDNIERTLTLNLGGACPAATGTPTPTASPTATSTATATATATSYATSTPTATPTIDPCVQQENCGTSTPEATHTPEATSTPDNDVCDNIDGIQTGVPADLHLDNSGNNCLAFELGGPSVQGTSTQGQVLGASTMPATGTFAENLYLAIMALGGTLTFKGLKNFKKAN